MEILKNFFFLKLPLNCIICMVYTVHLSMQRTLHTAYVKKISMQYSVCCVVYTVFVCVKKKGKRKIVLCNMLQKQTNKKEKKIGTCNIKFKDLGILYV